MVKNSPDHSSKAQDIPLVLEHLDQGVPGLLQYVLPRRLRSSLHAAFGLRSNESYRLGQQCLAVGLAMAEE